MDLKKKIAAITFAVPVADDVLMKAISEAGYELVSIVEKKGLLGRNNYICKCLPEWQAFAYCKVDSKEQR